MCVWIDPYEDWDERAVSYITTDMRLCEVLTLSQPGPRLSVARLQQCARGSNSVERCEPLIDENQRFHLNCSHLESDGGAVREVPYQGVRGGELGLVL